MKTTYIYIVLIALLSILGGCTDTPSEIKDKQENTLILETVLENQKGVLDSSINYTFYLPQAYNGITKLPVVFFFDPHANGSKPLQKYAKLANQYGYIFIASNNIKNGQAANSSLVFFEKLLDETKHRFLLDEKQLFTAGFSGGAKMAIVFAQQMSEIIGVAACGGSLPFTPGQVPNYYFAGIVGNKDFNFLELSQTFSVFDQQGFDYTSVIFDGAHQWPPANNFEMALIGFNIYSIKTKRQQKDDKWLEKIWQKMNDSILLYTEKNKIIKQNVYIKQTARWFYGIKNTKELDKLAYKIVRSSAFQSAAKKNQKLIQTEVKLRGEFIKAIELRDLEWWNKEISNINNSIQQNDNEVANVSQRLLNYISMASFILLKNDLDDVRLDNAAKKIKIYELVDPTNPDVYLMKARFFMMQNDVENMKSNYNKALALGFNDFETYKNDDSWSELMNRPELAK